MKAKYFLLATVLTIFSVVLQAQDTVKVLEHSKIENIEAVISEQGVQNKQSVDTFALKNKSISVSDYDKLRLAAEFGFGYRIAKGAPNADRKYVDGLRFGPNVSGGITFFPHKMIGFGVKTSSFFTSCDFDYIADLEGNYILGDFESETSTYMFGPQLMLRFPSKDNKFIFWMGATLCYTSYFEKIKLQGIELAEASGDSFGSIAEMGFDVKVTKNIAFGASANITNAAISNIKIKSLVTGETYKDEENTEGLARIGLNAGLRFYF